MFYLKIQKRKEQLKKMEIKDKARCQDQYWQKEGKKDLFTWVHRYLRLHSELLVDFIYKDMYEYYRNAIISCLKKDVESKKLKDSKLGKLADTLADIFNKDNAEYVNKYKALVEEIYNIWKVDSNKIKEIFNI